MYKQNFIIFALLMKPSESKYCGCLYFTSNALARKVEKVAIEVWKKAGLAPSHAYLLLLVLEEPGTQAGQLAEQLQLTPSTVTRLIEKLEEKKLVLRASEGKLTNVYPTQKAKDLKPQLRECIEELTVRYNKVLTKDENKHFLKTMHQVSERLEV